MRRFDEAITAHQRAAALFAELGDRHDEAVTLGNLGLGLGQARRFDEAITAHQQARCPLRRDSATGTAKPWRSTTSAVALQGARRFEEAITAHQRAAALFAELGDRHDEAVTLGNLGLGLGQARRFDEAITAHQQARALFAEFGDRHREAGRCATWASPGLVV